MRLEQRDNFRWGLVDRFYGVHASLATVAGAVIER